MGEQLIPVLLGAVSSGLLLGLLFGCWQSDLRHGQQASLLTRLLSNRDDLALRSAELGFGTTDLTHRIKAVREEIKMAELDLRIRRKHYDQLNGTLNELWKEALVLKRCHSDTGQRIRQIETAIDSWRQHCLLLKQGVEQRQSKLLRLEMPPGSG